MFFYYACFVTLVFTHFIVDLGLTLIGKSGSQSFLRFLRLSNALTFETIDFVVRTRPIVLRIHGF